MAGVDILVVKELLGHASLTMAMRYAHLAPDHRSRAIRTLQPTKVVQKLTQWKNQVVINDPKSLIRLVGPVGLEPTTV